MLGPQNRSTHNSTAFLYTDNEQVETKIKNTIPFSIAPKKIKHSGINLKTHVQNLYDENYKVSMKEIKEDLTIYLENHTIVVDWKTQRSKRCHFCPK